MNFQNEMRDYGDMSKGGHQKYQKDILNQQNQYTRERFEDLQKEIRILKSNQEEINKKIDAII